MLACSRACAKARKPPSRRRSRIRRSSRGWATFTSVRRSIVRGSRRNGAHAPLRLDPVSRMSGRARSWTPSKPCCALRSRRAACRCATIAALTARLASSSIIFASTIVPASHVLHQAVMGRSDGSCKLADRRSSARSARNRSPPTQTEEIMSTRNILVETHNRIGLIRLNRPQALNALNEGLKDELLDAAERFDADANIGCLVITGSEKAFAAGADIKEMAGKSYFDVFANDFAADYERLS